MHRLIVAGALANRPGNAGGAWVRASWVLGLARLGCSVLFLEELDPGERHPTGAPGPIEWFDRVGRHFGFPRLALLDRASGRSLAGLSEGEVAAFAEEACLLINLGGHLSRADLLSAVGTRAFVDLDPGFTQLWHAQGLADQNLESHHLHFTVGTNLGRPDCPVPTGGFEWIPIPPPTLTHSIRPGPDVGCAASGPVTFTTVGSWRCPFGPPELEGRPVGAKHHSFRSLLDLPARTPARFRMAFSISDDDHEDAKRLGASGWEVVDPAVVAPDPGVYDGFIRASHAEFSGAQGIYVEGRTGWMSDRTAHYLAAGRPAVVQHTGLRLDNDRPLAGTDGEPGGLLTYRTLEDAARAVNRIVRDYPRHALAARRLAEEWLDSDRILGRVLATAGLPPRTAPSATPHEPDSTRLATR